jgi:hypothetical protein
MDLHWIEVVAYILMGGIAFGVLQQRQSNLEQRVKTLERNQDELHQDLRRIELSLANVPTKEDFAKIEVEIKNLQLAFVRIEVLLTERK